MNVRKNTIPVFSRRLPATNSMFLMKFSNFFCHSTALAILLNLPASVQNKYFNLRNIIFIIIVIGKVQQIEEEYTRDWGD